jgi:hypothetical protein
MTAVKLAYALALPAVVGFLFVTWWSRRERGPGPLERLFLGFGIGTGMITFEMFLLGLLRVPLQGAVISFLQVVTVIILGYLLARSGTGWRDIIAPRAGQPEGPPGNATPWKRSVVILLSAWIIVKVLFVLYEGFSLPEHTSDSWEHWSLGAKFLYYERGLALDPASEHFFGAGYLKGQRYPLHVPLMQVWASICLGEAHEVYMKVWNSLLFVSMVGLSYCALRRRTAPGTALLAAFFLASVPLLTYHALTAYADLPLSFYALGGLVCFWDVVDARWNGRAGDLSGMLVLTGTCAALCAWTKMEGLFFVAAFSAPVLLFLRRTNIPLKRGIAYVIPLVLITVPWYAFLYSIGVPVSYGEGKMLGDAIERGIHLQVIPMIAEQVLFSANFNIIFPAFFLLMVLGCRGMVRSGLAYLYAAVLAVMVMFLVLYLGTETYRWVMNLTAVNRNILTFVPMMYYVSALTAYRLLQGEEGTRYA